MAVFSVTIPSVVGQKKVFRQERWAMPYLPAASSQRASCWRSWSWRILPRWDVCAAGLRRYGLFSRSYRCVSPIVIMTYPGSPFLSWWSWWSCWYPELKKKRYDFIFFHFDFHCMLSSGEEDLAFRGSIHSGCSHWRGTGATVEGVWTLAAAVLLQGLLV